MTRRRLLATALLACAGSAGALALGGARPGAAATPPLAGTTVYTLAGFGGRLWAGTDSGLFVQSPGDGWTAVGGPIAGREINALAVAPGGWLVAGTEDGAVRTHDGSSWASAGLGGERVASLSVAGAVLLAGTGHDTTPDGIVQRSDDSGGSWRPATSTPLLLGLPGQTVQAVLAPSGSSPAFAGTAGGGALRSSDGRGGWSGSSGMATTWVTAFWRDPAAGAVLAGSDEGLYSWTGSAWAAASFPQPNPWVQALATGSSGRPLAGTYDGFVYARGASGAWTLLASGLDTVFSLMPVTGGGVLVGTNNGLACIACPASIAAASAGPGSGGARVPRSLAPAGSRPGTSAAPSSSASPGAIGDATPSASGDAGALGTAGSSSGSGGSTKWWLAGGLAGLSVLLFAAGLLRDRLRRRRAAP